MKRKISLLLSLFCACNVFAHRSSDAVLEEGWLFINSDVENAQKPGIDTSSWEGVRIPHDWAIDGHFDMNIDLQYVKVNADGETEVRGRTGRTGALPAVGIGWYRKDLELPESVAGKRVYVQFDGAMSRAKVWLNGEYVGEWPYGYASFELDLTPFFKFGEQNTLAVRLENLPEYSRWYSGAGIYRNVRLVVKPQTHIAHWGTYVTTPEIDGETAVVQIETTVNNLAVGMELKTEIYGPDGKLAAEMPAGEAVDGRPGTVVQRAEINGAKLWSVETPNLYTAVSKIVMDGKTVDEYFTRFGIRSIKFDKDNGFLLNGKRVQIKGVCMHHDLGPIGAAVNLSATRRQLEILKDMGCNAIRTSHNPPSPELLNLCDEMGFVVVDEAFDEWAKGKCENGYNRFFKDWAEKDLTAMIMRDRNHPSVVMWSIGNEIEEQWQPAPIGRDTAKFLADIARKADPTRPVTAGINGHTDSHKNGMLDVLDVVGFNYKPFYYSEYRSLRPNAVIYGSETASTVSSRGAYEFPVKESKHPWHSSYQASSYDLECAPWSQTPEEEWEGQDGNPFVFGEFVWTGFDYLGEPFPYDGDFVAKSSYFGIVDLAGLKKDRFYLYRSRWNENDDTLHVLPHWNWPDRLGQNVPVFCYTNHPKAELFVNGKSMGVREKGNDSIYTRHRLMWNDVVYEPGEIKVVAYDRNGNTAGEKVVKTAGEPAALKLVPEKSAISADGRELCFVEVCVVDKDGNECPRADNIVYFQVGGSGGLRALCNGDPTDLTPFSSNYMRAFSGKLVAVVESPSKEKGEIVITASSSRLKSATARIAVE